MTSIVAFQPARRRRAIARAPRPEGAEILFFTGVRYERVLDLEGPVGPAGEPAALDAAPAAIGNAVERLQA